MKGIVKTVYCPKVVIWVVASSHSPKVGCFAHRLVFVFAGFSGATAAHRYPGSNPRELEGVC